MARPTLRPAERAASVGRTGSGIVANSPSSVGNLVSSSLSDSELSVAVRDAEIVNWVNKQRKYWDSIGENGKHEHWQSLHPTEQRLLKEQGFTPPPSNWLARQAWMTVAQIPREIWGGVQKADRFRQHYQAANVAMRDAMGGAATETLPTSVLGTQGQDVSVGLVNSFVPPTLSFSSWKKFWDQTQDLGENYFDDAIQEVVDLGYDDEQLEWMKAIASHLDASGGEPEVEQIVDAFRAELHELVQSSELDQERALAIEEQLTPVLREDENYQHAVKTLAKNHITGGSFAAQTAGLTPGTRAYSIVSGAADATAAFYADPFLVGGKAVKLTRFATAGVRNTGDIARHALKSRVWKEINGRDLWRSARSGDEALREFRDVVTDVIRTQGVDEVMDPAVARQMKELSDAINGSLRARVQYLTERVLRRGDDFDPKTITDLERLGEETSRGVIRRFLDSRKPANITQLIKHRPKFAKVASKMADDITGMAKESDLLERGFIRLRDDETWELARNVDEADVLAWFMDQQGLNSILNGSMAGHLRHVPVMPRISKSFIPLQATKRLMRTTIDWMDDSPLRMWRKFIDDDETWERVARAYDGALTEGSLTERVRRTATGDLTLAGETLQVNPLTSMLVASEMMLGRTLKVASRLAPRGGAIDLKSDESLTTIQRLTDLLPSSLGDQLTEAYAATRSVGQRMKVVRSIYDEIFTRMGLREANEEWVESFLRQMDESLGMKFALDELDKVTLPNGANVNMAIFTNQMSSMMALPDMRKLLAVSKRNNFWATFTGARVFNHEYMDFIVGRLWAPAVLLRMGFPLRAGGEEALQFILREGGMSFLSARRAARKYGTGRETVKDPLMRALSSIDEALESRMGKAWTTTRNIAQANMDHAMVVTNYVTHRWALRSQPLKDRFKEWLGYDLSVPSEVRQFERSSMARMLYRHARHNEAATSRVLSEVMASPHRSRLHMHSQHSLDDRATRTPETSLFDEKQFTGEWRETETFGPDEVADLRNRVLEMRDGLDAYISAQTFDDFVQVAADQVNILVATGEIEASEALYEMMRLIQSNEFRRKFVEHWKAAVRQDPQTHRRILDDMARATSGDADSIYTGTDVVEDLLGGDFGRYVFDDVTAATDGASARVDQFARGFDSEVMGSGAATHNTSVDDLVDSDLPDASLVVSYDYDGLFKPLRIGSQSKDYQQYLESVKERIRERLARLEEMSKQARDDVTTPVDSEGVERALRVMEKDFLAGLQHLRKVMEVHPRTAGAATDVLDEAHELLQYQAKQGGYAGFAYIHNGTEYKVAFEPGRLNQAKTMTLGELRQMRKRFITEDRALDHIARVQYDATLQRLTTYTRNQDKVGVPVPHFTDAILRNKNIDDETILKLHMDDDALLDEVAERYGLDADALKTDERLNTSFESTFGPVSEPLIDNSWDLAKEVTRRLFEAPFSVIGAMMDNISRDPAYISHLHKAGKEIESGLWDSRPGWRNARGEYLNEMSTYDTHWTNAQVREIEKGGKDIARALDNAPLDSDEFIVKVHGRDITVRRDTSLSAGEAGYYEDGTILHNLTRDDAERELSEIRQHLDERADAFDPNAAPSDNLFIESRKQYWDRLGVDAREIIEHIESFDDPIEAWMRFTMSHELGHAAQRARSVKPVKPASRPMGKHSHFDHVDTLSEMEADAYALNALGFRVSEIPGAVFRDAKHAKQVIQEFKNRISWSTGSPTVREHLVEEGDTVLANLLSVARKHKDLVPPREGEDTLQWLERFYDRMWSEEESVFSQLTQYAVNNTVPHIDNEAVASWMATWGRNMVPFWWAQERFMKRTMQTLYHSPESLHKLQMSYQGLQEIGVVHNEPGEEAYFIYPMVTQTNDAISAALSWLTGDEYRTPVVNQMTGRIDQSLPGIDDYGRPIPGFFASIPLRLLGDRFPELQGVLNPVIGDFASNRDVPLTSLFLPSVLTRAMKARTPEEAAQSYGSAYFSAMATSVANGFDEEMSQEDFHDTVENFTHITAVARVLYGFFGIAPPQVKFAEESEARNELFRLIETYGFEEGMQLWQAEHPDETAFSVFRTETVGGGVVDSTTRTLEFVNANQDYLERHKTVASYLIPPDVEGSEFDSAAWAKLMAMEIKRTKDPMEFYKDLKFAQFAPEHFARKERYEAELETVKGTPAAAEVRNRWSKYMRWVEDNRPTFLSVLRDSQRQDKREEVLRNLAAALADPDMPKNEVTDSLGKFYRGVQEYRLQMLELSNYNRKQHQAFKDRYKSQFQAWSTWMVQSYPWLEPFYRRVVEPELGLDSLDEIAALQEAS